MIAYGTTQFHVYSAASTVNKACRAKLQDIKSVDSFMAYDIHLVHYHTSTRLVAVLIC